MLIEVQFSSKIELQFLQQKRTLIADAVDS